LKKKVLSVGFMVKIFLDKSKINTEEKKYSFEQIKQFLADNNSCYILLTCTAPDEKGDMQVDMAYDGDEDLAGYLLASAQSYFHSPSTKSNDL
jgi:hypothetical protein